ncbi:unnamed protein product [Protopolystoma xenopodis]|uniref:Secreted protein n=1 Tax=Protopolystoma xenopodis TaxID=117903 RepID=A0A448XH83_9PLAT|nr:unnamed protein product [Protopolystoma xenopodis]
MASQILRFLVFSSYAVSLSVDFQLICRHVRVMCTAISDPSIMPLNVKYVVITFRLISRVNDSFRIRSASRMSSSRSNISIEALIAFSPEMLVYMDRTSKLTNSSDPTNAMIWIL